MKGYIQNLITHKRLVSTAEALSKILGILLVAGVFVWATWGILYKIWSWLSELLQI